ncbi:MAG: cyclic nucleotide-binding domain-containing protein [Pseudomonadota bacterium]
MNLTFGQATTPEQLAACMTLRYTVYTEEMNLYQSSEAEATQALTDADDAWARIFYAAVDGEIVGTSRANLSCDGPYPQAWNDIWAFDRFDPHCAPGSYCVSSRTTVAKAHRGGPLINQLFAYKVSECIKAGMRIVFLDCVPHLVGYYQRLGARVYTEAIEDADVGILVPMCIVFEDQPHLARVRSAFLPISQQLLPDSTRTPAWVHEVFHTGPYAEAALQQRAEKGLFELLAENRLPLFAGFAPEEVLKLTAGATLIDNDAGQLMIRAETVYRSVFVVLQGAVDVRAGGRKVAELHAGEVLGEMAYLLGGMRSATVHAGAEGAAILNLQEPVLRKVFEAEPALSARFHTNLARILALRCVGMGQQLATPALTAAA